eukprot:490837_1
MSLSKAVKFQFLAAQLTENETRLFINSVLQNHSQYIKMALFHRITILNIIQTRKKKPKPIKKQNIKLDSIPKSLIGVIASFLNQKNYINFSKCNRYIYLGCYTPNLMQELILDDKDHSSVNLCLYPSITYLHFNLQSTHELMRNTSITNVPVINQLEAMALNGVERNDCDINVFMTQNGINTNTITELTLNTFGKPNDKFDNAKFMQLLTKFPNINSLHFGGVYSDFDPNDIKKLYPNLKGLTLNSDTQQINISLL